MAEFVLQGSRCNLIGRLSQDEVKALWAKRRLLVPANATCLDLSQLLFVDSAGVAFLLEILAIQRKLKPEFELAAPAEQLEKLIALYDLEGFFTARAEQ